MPITYSAYEAKARFSEVLRQVRAGKTITISCKGEPVAEIRPAQIPPVQTPPVTLDERLNELERSGILVRSDEPRQPLRAVDRRPGALDRFLAGRHG